jgi:hypothetical protein
MQLSNFVTLLSRGHHSRRSSCSPIAPMGNRLRALGLEGKFTFGICLSEGSRNSLFQINQQ